MELGEFIERLKAEFPNDRLTYQRRIPTFHPESVEEAAKLFALAKRHGQRLFIAGFGNNITPSGTLFEKIIAVKTDRLNSMVRVVPEDFYVVVEAGYPLNELNGALKDSGLFFPHSLLPYAGSIGGALAIGLTAKQDQHLFPISKYLLQAEIATPDGKVIRPGSACFKSVSGFDIVKIFSPSWGLLGLIATVTLRVLPLSLQKDFHSFRMQAIEYGKFIQLYTNPGENQSAAYSIKIKNKFDPAGILPLIIPE